MLGKMLNPLAGWLFEQGVSAELLRAAPAAESTRVQPIQRKWRIRLASGGRANRAHDATASIARAPDLRDDCCERPLQLEAGFQKEFVPTKDYFFGSVLV